MARLYAVCSLGRDSRDPHPPRGPLAEQQIDGGALVPPCASHGDSARHTALARRPARNATMPSSARLTAERRPGIEQC